MDTLFPGDRYSTPDGVRTALSEHVLLHSRWSVYCHFFATVLRSRAKAVKGEYDDEAWALSSWDVIKGIESCGARLEIGGMDKVRAEADPVVFVANHMSTLETLVLPGLIRPLKPVTYVVKVGLTKGPIWGPVMRSREPIAVTRKDARADLETVLREGQSRLSKGISVIVFPQGTRTETWKREGFNSLGVKLATRAGVKIQPVALKTDYWGAGGLFRGFGPIHRERRIHFEFGEAMPVSGRGKSEHEACLDFIEARLKAWGAKTEA